MARARQTVTNSSTKTRVKKDGSSNNAGYETCRMCGETGVQKSPKKK